MLEQLQGRELSIDSLKLETIDNRLILSLDVLYSAEIRSIVFYNISSFCADRLHYPLQIAGFEIIDNHCNGWQSEVRYKVHDFEDETISFYCEKIEMIV